jgi:hypothetical protein
VVSPAYAVVDNREPNHEQASEGDIPNALNDLLTSAFELISPDILKLWQIARDTSKSYDERYGLLVTEDERFKGYTSKRMGELLDCTDSRIRQIRKKRKEKGEYS